MFSWAVPARSGRCGCERALISFCDRVYQSKYFGSERVGAARREKKREGARRREVSGRSQLQAYLCVHVAEAGFDDVARF